MSKIHYFRNEESFDKKVTNAIESYQLLTTSPRIEDVKIIEMIDPEIMKHFEQKPTDQVIHSSRYRSRSPIN
jgi:hypothetical protein